MSEERILDFKISYVDFQYIVSDRTDINPNQLKACHMDQRILKPNNLGHIKHEKKNVIKLIFYNI